MSECGSTHCVTCSDEAVELRVECVRADGIAVCANSDHSRVEVMVDLVAPVEPGDVLLVHAGVALGRAA